MLQILVSRSKATGLLTFVLISSRSLNGYEVGLVELNWVDNSGCVFVTIMYQIINGIVQMMGINILMMSFLSGIT